MASRRRYYKPYALQQRANNPQPPPSPPHSRLLARLLALRLRFLGKVLVAGAAVSLLVAGAMLFVLKIRSQEEVPLTPFEAGRQMLLRSDGIGAEAQLRKAMADGVPSTAVAAYMGEAELLQGQLAEARAWLEEGQFDEASAAHGFHMLARLEMIERNLPQAGQAFDAALQRDGQDPELWVGIGRLRFMGGEQLQAIEASKRAAELGPDNVKALHFRGQLVRDAYGLDAALPWFEAAYGYDQTNPLLLNDLAATYGELGRARDMLAIVRKLARVDPGNRRIFYLQAVLAARAGDAALARTLLERSGDLDRGVPAAVLLSSLIDMQSGNYASASQALEKLSIRQPDNHRVRLLFARSLALGGNDRELVHRFSERALRPSASPYLIALVARAYERLGERANAATYLDRAVRPRSSNLIALRGSELLALRGDREDASSADIIALLRRLIAEGRHDAAYARAEKFRKRFSGSADAASLVGDVQLVRKNARAALQLYRTAMTVRQPWHLTRRMIMASTAMNDPYKTLEIMAGALRASPGNIEAASVLAVALGEAESWESAGALVSYILAKSGTRDPRIVLLGAHAALAQGETGRALQYARRAYRMQPLNPMAVDTLIMAREAAGEDPAVTGYLVAKSEALNSD